MDVEVLNQILDHSLSFACDQLESEGYFYPFSFVLNADGELMRSGDLTEEEKLASPEKIIDQMNAMLAAGCRQKLHKAVALVCDVKVERFKSEGFVKAVEVIIDYEDGTGFKCYLPYKNAQGKFQYGSLFHVAFDSEKFKAE